MTIAPHKIILKDGAILPRLRQYKIPPQAERDLISIIEDLIKAGCLRRPQLPHRVTPLRGSDFSASLIRQFTDPEKHIHCSPHGFTQLLQSAQSLCFSNSQVYKPGEAHCRGRMILPLLKTGYLRHNFDLDSRHTASLRSSSQHSHSAALILRFITLEKRTVGVG
ncbi:hypothetical protein NDU88_006813 [Pleurodeles waltl]|uniref:Uncharacterized protein n=1 Tax=Pleurodeles waltl TaxID=8319 RepID=A0AAV7LQ74_PLEWA|nr:hypothetical protein NDU88_006813 [Pleurodeles waltl]